MTRYASVILDQGLDRPLDYQAIDGTNVGYRVLVPVQNSLRKGTVVALKTPLPFQKFNPLKRSCQIKP